MTASITRRIPYPLSGTDRHRLLIAFGPGTDQHVLSATERIHRALFSDYVSQRSNPERPVR